MPSAESLAAEFRESADRPGLAEAGAIDVRRVLRQPQEGFASREGWATGLAHD